MTKPEAIPSVLRRFGDDIKRVGFEASSLSPWLSKLGFPAIIVETRHMASALGAIRVK